MAILKNTSISGTGHLRVSAGTTEQRPRMVSVVETFTRSSFPSGTTWTCPTGVNQIELLMVAGGGGGGNYNSAGGGGAGGLIYRSNYTVTPGNTYNITIGAGGTGGSGTNTSPPTNGGNTTFGALTAIGGGFGSPNTQNSVGSGGSGGGGGNTFPTGGAGQQGQGYPGGTCIGGGPGAPNYGGGGGGGAGEPGTQGYPNYAGGGGNGLRFSISGTPTWYAGGGGGSTQSGGRGGKGGFGGGGDGGVSTNSYVGSPGTANTGGGGGAGGYPGSPATMPGGNGGSGIVILKYRRLADNSDPAGLIRYNIDLKDIETYDSYADQWLSQDVSKNYAGHNLVATSESFTTGWTAYQASIASSIAAPHGYSGTAIKLTATTTGTTYSFYNYSQTQNLSTFSIFAKSAEYTRFGIGNRSSYNMGVIFDLSNGTVVDIHEGTGTVLYTSITDAGDGWYRCSVTMPITNQFNIHPLPANVSAAIDTQNNYGPLTSGSGVHVFGAQWEVGVTTPGPYTKTAGVIAPAPSLVGNYRIHTYTTVGESSFTPAVTGEVDVLVVAGGGGGGGGFGFWAGGGGGGAGGLIYEERYRVESMKNYTVVVGAGGAGQTGNTSPRRGFQGSNSRFSDLIAIGGGGGGSWQGAPSTSGAAGGGSGGGGANSSGFSTGGGGVYGQGFPGGTSTGYSSGSGSTGAGGGGAGGPGARNTGAKGGDGGIGRLIGITGTPTWYASGGGGGGSSGDNQGFAPSGGGAPGGPVSTNAPNATANTGGGGGGAGNVDPGTTNGGQGGSGIVVVRYRIA